MNAINLRFHDVSKCFGNRTVINPMSHEFGTGLYALHGPNGIGKSTLLSLLAGIEEPDTGKIHIRGHNLLSTPLAAKACLSYVPDECPIYPFMTGSEFLQFVARAKGTTVTHDIEALLERFELSPFLDTRFAQMSLGTQKKTLLASAWIGSPTVFLMDEPSNGLDLLTRDVLIAEIKKLREHALVIVSTHDAEFAASIGAEILLFSELEVST